MPGCHQQFFLREIKKLGYKYTAVSRSPALRQLLLHHKWTDGGLIIASKFPIVQRTSIVFKSAAAGLDAGASKGVVYAKVQFGKRFLQIFNTHLQASHANSSK